MRQFPTTEEELEESKDMKAKDWQVDCLKMNPDYVHWGNHEDYMCKKSEGWDNPVEIEGIDQLWELNELNELINFYFFVNRGSKNCDKCEGSGLNKATNKLDNDWYTHLRTDGKEGWQYHLTDIEIEALVKAGRLNSLLKTRCYYDEDMDKWVGWINGKKQQVERPKLPSTEQVNAWARKPLSHDSLNRMIAVKARAKHLGVYGECEACNGLGYIYTEPEAKLGLQMWFIYPRKGAARGVLLNEIKKHEVQKVIEYLKEARDRNFERFSKL